LTPDEAHRAGEKRHRSHLPPWPAGQWALESESELATSGNHLEDHLKWLLDRLEPHVQAVRELCARDNLLADFFCGYFMGQSNSGFSLTAHTLARIASLGADLSLDIYGERVETELEHWVKPSRDA
jgi:Domain of unknown function (DUF4279)